MSSLNTFLDGLFRSHVNGMLPGVKRAEKEEMDHTYCQVWLKDVQDPLQLKGVDRAKSLLAIMQGISHIVDIICRSGHCRINFLGEEEQLQDHAARSIVSISWEPIMRRPQGYSFLDAVDVMTGCAIHQAVHVREEWEPTPFDSKEEQYTTLTVLYHLVLDVFHDQIITIQYPGYEGYLLKYRDYLIFEKLRKQWGIRSRDRVNMFIQALRSTQPIRLYKRNVLRAYYYVLYHLSRFKTVEELRRVDLVDLTHELFVILYDEKLFNLTRDLNYMSERLVLASQGMPTPGEKGKEKGGQKNQSEDLVDHKSEDHWMHVPLTGSVLKELKMEKAEIWEQNEVTHGDLSSIPSDESIESALVEELLHQYGSHGTLFSKRGLKRKEIENMKQLKDEEYTQLEHTDKKFRYQIRKQIPQLTEELKQEYAKDRKAIARQITLLRNQWSWANTKRILHQYGLKSGRLDEDALYQAKYSKELFMNPIIENTRTRKLDLILLIDASSSMFEQTEGIALPKYKAARQLAALFVESLETITTAQTWVYSFMQDMNQSVLLQELYSPEKNARKECLAALSPGYRTPEYEALLAVSKLVEEEGRIGVQKVILILSDGQPGDDLIPYPTQKIKIKELVGKLEKQGYIIIQIALGSEALSKEMYRHYVAFPEEGYQGLVLRFGKLLKSLI